MSGPIRRVCAGLLAATVLFVAAPQASALAAPSAPSAVAPPVRPAPTQAPPDLGRFPCLPGLGCDPLGGLGDQAANAMAQAVFNTFATFVADGVGLVLKEMSMAISQTTQEKLDRQWFDQHYGVMRTLAVLVLLPMMLVGLISAIIHRDASQLVRAAAYVPVAIIGAGASVMLTDQALRFTDAATTFVTGDINSSVARAMATLASAVKTLASAGTPGLGTFLAILVLLFLMAGAVVIWMELLLRTSAIYVVVLFLPLAMTGLVWRGTVAWTRRMIEVLVALILSKFVIVVVLDLAAGMVTAGDGIGTVMQGATLLLLAAFAPFALLRLVPMVEAGVIGHLERMERRPLAAAHRTTAAVARQAVAGAEAATAGRAIADNGGDPAAISSQQREPGGQLNSVQIPPESGGRPPAAPPAPGSPPAPGAPGAPVAPTAADPRADRVPEPAGGK